MATAIDSAPSNCPDTLSSGAETHIEGSRESPDMQNTGETMQERVDESGDSASVTQPVDEATPPSSERELRKRSHSEVSGGNKYLSKGGAALAAREFCRLEGYHGEFSMRKWAVECEVPRPTLQYQLNKLSTEERATLNAIGRLEREKEVEAERAAQKRSHWEQKAVEKLQVGHDALYLRSGVTFQKYQEAYVWGVQQIVAGKMQPAVAQKAVKERFGATISKDCMRIAAKRYATVESVEKPKRTGRSCALEEWMEEGLVEIVEMMQAMSPPFPVFKSWVIERAQALVQQVPEYEWLWAARDNKPTDRWYNGWKNRWAHRLKSCSMSLIEHSRVEWATAKNVKTYFDVVFQRLSEIGYVVPNPKYDETVAWTKSLQEAGDDRIIRGTWTREALLRVISFDETELTTNVAGNGRSGSSKKRAERALVALRVSNKAKATANKTSQKASGIGGSNPNWDSIPICAIYNSEPQDQWFQHPEFKLPQCTWICPADGQPFKPKLLCNESGGATNESAVQWLQWLLSNTGDSFGGIFSDCSPETPCVLICDGHGSHLSYEFLDVCLQRGVILILRPPHTSHVTQGEDLINFFNYKGAARMKALLASSQKYRLQWLYTDPLAWGGNEARRTAQLGNSDLMYCVRDAWEAAFSREKCRLAWAVSGLNPFTQRPYWELKEQEERSAAAMEENRQSGITGVDWLHVAQLRSAEGQAVTLQELNAQIDRHRTRRRAINSSTFWNSPRAMEELHAAQLERNEERDAVQTARQERQDANAQKRKEAIEKARSVLTDLFSAVIEDNGRWRFKSREGRTGAKLTKDHLEAVFIATGQKVPASKMDNLLPLAQTAAHWNADTLQFEAKLMWNEEKQAWGFFHDAAPQQNQ